MNPHVEIPLAAAARRHLDEAAAHGGVIFVNGPAAFGHVDVLSRWARDHPEYEFIDATPLGRDGVRAILSASAHARAVVAASIPDLFEAPGTTIEIALRHFVLTGDDIWPAIRDIPWLASADVSESLLASSGGWPGLVALAIRAARNRAETYEAARRISHHVVREAAIATLLPWLPEAWRARFEYASLAAPVHPRELANGDDESFAIAAVGLGLLEQDPNGQELRVVAPLHAALTATLASSGRTTVVLTSVADRRLREGFGDCGLSAARSMRDWHRCARILDTWWLKLWFGPNKALADTVMQEIPEATLVLFPAAALCAEVYALLPVGTVPVAVPRTERQVEQTMVRRKARMTLEHTALRMMALRHSGGSAQQAHQLAIATGNLARTAALTESDGDSFAAVWYLQAGVSSLLAGQVAPARQFFLLSWQLREADETGIMAIDAAIKLAVLEALAGEYAEAERWLHNAEGLRHPEGWVAGLIIPGIQTARTLIDTAAGRAAPASEDALWTAHELWPFTFAAIAENWLAHGNIVGVMRLIDDLPRLKSVTVDSDGVHRAVLVAYEARAHLANGRGSAAATALRRVPKDFSLRFPLDAWLLLANEDWAGTAHMASVRVADPATPVRVRRELQLALAVAAAAGGQVDLAAAQIAQVATSCDKDGDVEVLRRVPQRSADLLRERVAGAEELLSRAGGQARDTTRLVSLTQRERVVLRELVTASGPTEIAERLVVARNTVKAQLASVYRKLGVSSAQEALSVASELGLLTELPDRVGGG